LPFRGGAHRDKVKTIESVKSAIAGMLGDLAKKDRAGLIADRRDKYLDMGTKGLAA
jgi:acetyl-CoA carboxylase carboxyl transferase subunit alpha